MQSSASTAAIQDALIRALEQAQSDGSPVAGSTLDARKAVAAAAIRRIRSFARRGISDQDYAGQVRDLAKGLAAQFERDPHLVGPLIKDYQWLADALLQAYAGAD